MTRFHITVILESDNSWIATTRCSFVPRIGEQVMYISGVYVVKSIRYDLHETSYSEQPVILMVERVS
jgi:hypothetical protein